MQLNLIEVRRAFEVAGKLILVRATDRTLYKGDR